MSSRDMYARWGEEFPNLQEWRCADYVCPREQYLPSRLASPPPDSPYNRSELDAARHNLLSTILTDRDSYSTRARTVYTRIGIPSSIHASVYRHVFEAECYPQYLVQNLDFSRFDVDNDSGYLALHDDSGNCSGSMDGSTTGNQSQTRSNSVRIKQSRIRGKCDMSKATTSKSKDEDDLREDSEDMVIPGYDKSSDEETEPANNDSDVNKLWSAFKIDGVGKTVTKLRGQSISSEDESNSNDESKKLKNENKAPISISSDTDGIDNEKPSTSGCKTREKRTCSSSSQDEVFEVVHVSEDSSDHREYVVLDTSFAEDDGDFNSELKSLNSDGKNGQQSEKDESGSVRVNGEVSSRKSRKKMRCRSQSKRARTS